MIWYDINLKKIISIPNKYYLIGICTSFYLVYGAIKCFLIQSNLEDNIMAIIGGLSFIYFGFYCLFIFLRGSRYVKSIQKEERHFILINLFNIELIFEQADVYSVEPSKHSFLENFLTDFGGKNPGFLLLLKNKQKFRITSNMEDIDSLRECLVKNLN
ncbi:MAG: hypothetical protein H0U57_14020 [Tatlockia sp.]|nr:hypothetical protein [Tatlockia sp.]